MARTVIDILTLVKAININEFKNHFKQAALTWSILFCSVTDFDGMCLFIFILYITFCIFEGEIKLHFLN